MPPRSRSPKKYTSEGRSRNGLRKHHGPKPPPLASPTNQNPGIDVALRNLNHEARISLGMYQVLFRDFEGQIEQLQDWADDYTLDTVWRNKIKDQYREKRNKERVEGVTIRILACRMSIKDAIAKAKVLKAAWDDQYRIEQQIRTAKKALLYCDGIINLAERATSERLACKLLLTELEETQGLLDGRKHPWICE